MINISELIQLSEAAGAAVPTNNIFETEFVECPDEYKNLSMSESSLYFENQMLRCELEYRDMMDESVNEMIQDMINRKNGIINESAVDIKSKLKKIKDFITKIFTTILNAIKNFIIKAKEALNLIGKKMDVSALDNAQLMKPEVIMLDSDDTTYKFDVKLRPFNITNPKCAKEVEDEINLTFGLLYNLIENVMLDEQTLDKNNSKELFNSIDDIIDKYCINVVKVLDNCTRDGQYKKHRKYNQLAGANFDYTAKSNIITDKFGESSEDSAEITFKLSDYMKVDDRKSDEMFSELVKKSTGVDYSSLLSGVNDYLKTMEALAKQSSKDREKLEKLVEKISFNDDQKDTSESDMKIRLMAKIIEATRTMYESVTSICISNINTFIANKASFTKAFIAAKHDYIMWSSNNKKKNRFTNKNEEEDAKSRKKNSDDFDPEDD